MTVSANENENNSIYSKSCLSLKKNCVIYIFILFVFSEPHQLKPALLRRTNSVIEVSI